MVLKEGEIFHDKTKFLRNCKFTRKSGYFLRFSKSRKFASKKWHLNKNETNNKFKKSPSSGKDHVNSRFYQTRQTHDLNQGGA